MHDDRGALAPIFEGAMSHMSIEPVPARSVIGRPPIAGTFGERLQAGRTTRALAAVTHETTVRIALVQEEGIVQTEKCHEIDNVAREAITGQVMLHHWSQTLAAGDLFVADELKFFIDTAKLGKGDVLADTISTYCRESRR